MQTLKDEIRDEILSAARDEFRSRGFSGASMQRIAGRAGLSVSNIYNYFSGKEALFSQIVDGARGSLAHLVKEIPVIVEKTGDREKNARALGEFVPSALFNLIKTEREGLIIILERGAGTKYADIKDKLADSLSGIIMSKAKGTGSKAFLVRVIAMNLIQGLVEIAKEYRSDPWAEENIRSLVQYHIQGMMELSR